MSVHLSYVGPSIVLFPDDNLSGFSPNMVCALILWRYGLGLLIGIFCQFLTVICPPQDSG